MPFIALEKRQHLKNGDCRPYRVAGRKVLLIQQNDRYFAIDSICPHAGASLRKGRLAGGCIRCPRHGIYFDLDTGRAVGGDAVADVAPLHCFEVVLQDDVVGILV